MPVGRYFVSLFLLLIVSTLWSQSGNTVLSGTIKIKAGTYTVGSILEKLNSDKNLNITYNTKEIPIELEIEIKNDNPSLKNLLEDICNQAPIDYQIVNGYVILKKRKLSSNYTIKGKVLSNNEKEPMIGVNVYLTENLKGTITNANGEYSFSAIPGNYTLIFSFLGYQKTKFDISLFDNLNINATLSAADSSIEIEEVKIYGQRQFFGNMNEGRTIESIGSKAIENQNINNAADILHARFTGIWATKTSGLPGDHQRIRIRGLNSLYGSVDPLYVIDGVPVPVVNLSSLGIADLNIHDIDNVTILKEASSTALYGFQGGNGVVLIETKQGGAKEIDFSVKFGFQRFNNFYDLMDTRDFLASLDLSKQILKKKIANYYPRYSDSLCSKDWQDVIFQDGIIQEYQLSASGNKKKNNYYISGNYLNHKGIIAGSSYRRYTLSTNISHSFFDFLKASINYKGSIQDNLNNQDTYMGNRLIFEGINKSPCLECTPDSFYHINSINSGSDPVRIYYDYTDLKNRESTEEFIKKNTVSLKNISNTISGSAKMRFTENLSMNLAGSLSYKRNNYSSTKEPQNISDQIYFLKSTEDYITINHLVSLNFLKSFGSHNVGFNGAFRNYKDNIWWNVDSVFNSVDFTSLPESFYIRNTMSRYGQRGSVIRSIQSFIGHASYNFKEKYFLSVAANYDRVREGFNTDKKVLFPSIAISWNIAEEKPFRNLKWMNSLNVFANWGISGNFPLNGLSNDLYEKINTTYGSQTTSNPVIFQLANHYLKHEQIEEYNLGVKGSLFDSRISWDFVYFEKTNSNLIIQRKIPDYYGGGKQYININELFNRGYELGLELIPVETTDFTWLTSFNYSTYHQVVTKFEDTSVVLVDNDILVPDFVIEEGKPLGNMTGFKIYGTFNPATDSRTSHEYRIRRNMKVLNADSSDISINDKDKVIIGNSMPDFTWNWYTSLKYKNFMIDFLWYAVIGLEKYNATRAGTLMAGTNSEINNYISDTTYLFDNRIFYESSIFVEDASFIRLKSLTISYEPRKLYLSKVKVRLSLSFENLVTITKYKGFDPEATIYTDNNFTDNAIDRGAFPNPKAFYVTLNLKF